MTSPGILCKFGDPDNWQLKTVKSQHNLTFKPNVILLKSCKQDRVFTQKLTKKVFFYGSVSALDEFLSTWTSGKTQGTL